MYDWLCDGKLITGWIAHSESEIPKSMAFNIRPLYTTPPQRIWVGLTDDEIKKICEKNKWDSSWQSLRFARAIEAAHGIKENT